MRLLVLFIFLGLNLNILGQDNTVNIWEVVPNRKETSEKEVIEKDDITKVFLVQTPTLNIFLPSKRASNGKAVIICPGGAYRGLAYDWEGIDVAKWFNTRGIAAFVLKYRLPDSSSIITGHQAPLQDAQRAMRWVRYHAKEYSINPNKIGIMGFSAGGHVASTLGVRYDSPNNFEGQKIDTISARPDFMVLVYPVITMKDDYAHKGSQNNLLGTNASDALKNTYSNELQVHENTPRTFIVHSSDDRGVPVENSLHFYKALNDKGIKVEMHIYPSGGHRYSLAIGKDYLQTWTDRLGVWLESL